jgi:hypothetical protein
MLGVTLFGVVLTPVFYYVLQSFGKEPPRHETVPGVSASPHVAVPPREQ